MAIINERRECLLVILSHCYSKSQRESYPLHRALLSHITSALSNAIKNNPASLSLLYMNGWTLLCLSFALADADITKLLLEQFKANPNDQNSYGRCLIHIAFMQPTIEMLDLLCSSSDLDVNVKDDAKLAALHYAALSNSEEAFITLTRYPHININIRDQTSFTPLHYIAREGYSDIMDDVWYMSPNSCLFFNAQGEEG